MRKLILQNFQSPGDILMLTAAVRDLHWMYPGAFATDVRTPCPQLWEHNPYITPLSEGSDDVEVISCDYPLIHESDRLPYHFIHGFRMFLEERLGVVIKPSAFKGDVHITDEEKSWLSQVDEVVGAPNTPFWIIVAGGKTDFTAKWWDPARCQQVVDYFSGGIRFVQCGQLAHDHRHTPLTGVIDLVGQTDLRQLVRLMYHAEGVICPVTMFMHLSSAVETRPDRPATRPCVVVAGGREPTHWEAYPGHRFLHSIGALPCCDQGGCWKSRVIPLGDGDEKDRSLCDRPVETDSGAIIPRCLDMIGASDVINAVKQYLEYHKPALVYNKNVFAGDHKSNRTSEMLLCNTNP